MSCQNHRLAKQIFNHNINRASVKQIAHSQATTQKRQALLQELFGTTGASIGVSYLRLTIGASDMNDHVFTYDDLPAGQTDLKLKQFTLDPDPNDVIPVMQQILKINPHLKIMATPWSAPSWMKTNQDPKGGSLKPEF